MKLKRYPQPYHLVDSSPWPLMTALSLFILVVGLVSMFNGLNCINFLLGLINSNLCIYLWWKDVIIESTFLGKHTVKVQNGIKIGFYIFIFSEIFLFIALFWGYFHASLAPSVELGSNWPPLGVESVNPRGLPLLNTIILLSSGAFVTWAHYCLIKGNKSTLILSLGITIFLASIFSGFQLLEYSYTQFTIADGIYGNVFYFLTGLHAIHVLFGNTFLFVSFIRILKNHLSEIHSVGLELGILYWHFVDVIWLLLFVIVYFWGS